MYRHLLRPLAVWGSSLLLLSMLALPTSAFSHPLLTSMALLAGPDSRQPRIDPTPFKVCCKGGYIYVEDGTNPDSIDGYQIASTPNAIGHYQSGDNTSSLLKLKRLPGSPYKTNALNGSGSDVGSQRLAIAGTDKAHGNCLLLLDSNNLKPPGFVDSFSINKNGSLSSEVSHLQVAGGGDPTDIHIAGDTAYVTSPGSDLESYGIGAGCTLTFLAMTATSQFYTNFALVGSTELVAPDVKTSAIGVYTLGPGGTITLLASISGQLSSPDGAAVQTVKTKSGVDNNIFTGENNNSTATVQAGQLNTMSGAVSFLKGSPANDPSGVQGIALAFDSKDSLLIEAETLSASLGVYQVKPGAPGSVGSIILLERTLLAVSSDKPQLMAQLGNILFVDGGAKGDIEACLLRGSVSGCSSVATLKQSNYPSGLVALCDPTFCHLQD